ncbi:MAG TPA: DUF3095 domain-containing protein [Bacteroidota bacterium]
MEQPQDEFSTDREADGFYASIPPVRSFEDLANSRNFVPLPSDWYVVVADVVNSTSAIQRGNYKSVNTVGVSVIAATINIVRPTEVPYVFGGDGALVCIPGWSVRRVTNALAATLAMSIRSFGLILRAAVIPASYIRSGGADILVARHQISPHYVQSALFGGGPEAAESMLKSGSVPGEFLVKPDAEGTADYSGLECRWQEIRSPRGETVAIIIRSSAKGPESLSVFNKVIRTISSVYGDDKDCKPVTEESVRAALSYRVLRHELRLKNWKSAFPYALWKSIVLRGTVVLGWFLMKFGLRFNNADWGVYKRDLVANTDFRKFDGALRLVLSGSPRQRERLTQYLTWLREQGEVTFGIHVSDAAIMTCLVQQRQSVHFHFVDAAGGGYALAARSLKNPSS